MAKYMVRIQETLKRDVIIEAEDRYEAEEIGENLCNSGTIDLAGNDFSGRIVSTIRKATSFDETVIKEEYKNE